MAVPGTMVMAGGDGSGGKVGGGVTLLAGVAVTSAGGGVGGRGGCTHAARPKAISSPKAT